MKDIALQAAVKRQLEKYSKSQPHAMLLEGRRGVGLATVAQSFAEQLTDSAYIFSISPDETGTIKIKKIRELYDLTRTKQLEKQVIIIDDADKMQHPAQNALLKLLEEPPENVMFILTSHKPQLLLSTIVSRVQVVEVLPIADAATLKILDNLRVVEEKKRAQVLFIGHGLPAELHRLAEDSEYFAARRQSMSEARQFIQGTAYDRLVAVYRLGSDRAKATALLEDASQMVEMSLKQKPSRQLSDTLSSLLEAQEKLLSDGNIKVQLLKLSLML